MNGTLASVCDGGKERENDRETEIGILVCGTAGLFHTSSNKALPHGQTRASGFKFLFVSEQIVVSAPTSPSLQPWESSAPVPTNAVLVFSLSMDLAGVPFTALSNLLPFILVGIGVDDMVSSGRGAAQLLVTYLTSQGCVTELIWCIRRTRGNCSTLL